jgi:hypothetical protein
VLKAVDRKAAVPRELGLFIYGAWTRALSSKAVTNLARRLATSSEPRDLEAALGMLSYWLDENDDPDVEFRDLALWLTGEAAKYAGSGHTMLDFYRQSVFQRIGMPPGERLRRVETLLNELSSGWLSDSDLQAFDDVAREQPDEATAMVFRVVLGTDSTPPSINTLWLNRSKLLSRLASVTAPDRVADAIRGVPVDRWRELVAHVSFDVDAPNEIIDTLVSSDADDVTRGRSAVSFMYPEEAWFGNESEYLRARIPVAKSWKDQARRPATRRWIDEVLTHLDARIAQAEQREQEERW